MFLSPSEFFMMGDANDKFLMNNANIPDKKKTERRENVKIRICI